MASSSPPHVADALAALAWQVELGADEAILDAPVNRYETPAPPPPAAEPTAPVEGRAARVAPPVTEDAAVSTAARIAAGAATLEALRAGMEAFDGCALKKGARNFVFCDGHATADLMIVGEAPGAEEDRAGLPFVGRSGQLLDRMLAAISRDRKVESPEAGAYITNVLPWRPPQNRDPSTDEMAIMKAFLMRHIDLAAPRVLLCMGNAAMKTLFDTKDGITMRRGKWEEVQGIPAMATFHPAALLRDPLKKREVWRDLVEVQARLRGAS
ncbi:MAG: uracil-DNA glycosylase [Pseudomonadota bacterium]